MNPKSPKMVHHLGTTSSSGPSKSLQLNLKMIQHHRPNRGLEGGLAVLEALGVAPGRLGASLMKHNFAKNNQTSWLQVVLRALQNLSKNDVTKNQNRCKNAPNSIAGGMLGGSWKPLKVARVALGRLRRWLGAPWRVLGTP